MICATTESRIVKVCACGRSYTFVEWILLPFVGRIDLDADGDRRGEMRNCSCGSTLCVDSRRL